MGRYTSKGIAIHITRQCNGRSTYNACHTDETLIISTVALLGILHSWKITISVISLPSACSECRIHGHSSLGSECQWCRNNRRWQRIHLPHLVNLISVVSSLFFSRKGWLGKASERTDERNVVFHTSLAPKNARSTDGSRGVLAPPKSRTEKGQGNHVVINMVGWQTA